MGELCQVESSGRKTLMSDLNSLPSRVEGNRPSDIFRPSNKYIIFPDLFTRGLFLNSGTVKYLHANNACHYCIQ